VTDAGTAPSLNEAQIARVDYIEFRVSLGNSPN
jgi:hypothetical protein